MRLYFLRHTSASESAPSDAERELTAEGREEARIAGAALAELGAKPSYIFSSPLVRAQQTAEIVAKALGRDGNIEALDELTNDVSTSSLLNELKRRDPGNEVLLVGHMPSLSEHVAALIGARNADGLPFGKGGVACVEVDQLRTGHGRLQWIMRQKQLRKIAG
jgi:phosphohistidine phosphatase